MVLGLKEPKGLQIDFRPSPKQYDVWKNLQPECPVCGGEIAQKMSGVDRNGNPTFKPVCSKCGNENIPQMILTGGAAGGGKSYLGSCWLISSCLRWPDMRMVVGRKTLKSLRESTWNTILSVCKSWGLVEGENYKVNNLSGEMIFWNGSKIIMKEMAYSPSDPSWLRFGSSEYSGGFIDEVGEIEERGVDVLFSRIRWKVHETFKVPKLLMSTNPCLGWVRDRFVIDNNGDPVQCREGELYLPFSVFDNPDVAFRNAYAASLRKINDPTTVERLLYGNWMWVDSNEAAAYYKFDGSKHLVDNLKEKVYNPLKPIILSFDFNVIPFMSCLAFQIDYDNKKIYVWKRFWAVLKKKTTTLQSWHRKFAINT